MWPVQEMLCLSQLGFVQQREFDFMQQREFDFMQQCKFG